MRIKITEASKMALTLLTSWGFSKNESEYITENLMEGELTDKKTHGLVRLLYIKKKIDAGGHNLTPLSDLEVISESSNHLYINGNKKIGLGVIYKSLDLAFEKMKNTKMLSVGIKNLGLTGFIGAFARKAVKKDLIFIGFHNSTGGLIPHGSAEAIFGTNPITVGVPSEDIPVILDMASSQITWGDLLVAKNEGKEIKEGVAVDSESNVTTDPDKAMDGGLLPIAGHKGSGIAFIVELLAGALTGSRCGFDVEGGWGSFYILLDPTLFRPLPEFKKDVTSLINEIKNSRKAPNVEEIYFAGEQSSKIRKAYLDSGEVEISDKLYSDLQSLMESN